QLDADNYENDPCLEEIRRAENYSWMDIVTIHKDKLPNYEEKVTRLGVRMGVLASHQHPLRWGRKRSLRNYVKAMRLFAGEPVWTAYNRPADDFPARKRYLKSLAQGAE
ncbi:MTND dioxygenase, partial [Centropus bengalensis]|nr:MTND dioxygenase [Centropus bengalensis]